MVDSLLLYQVIVHSNFLQAYNVLLQNVLHALAVT